MKRHDYIKSQAAVLKRLCDKRDKVSARYLKGELTQKMYQNLSAELNFTGMEIEKTKERIAFALGYLIPENAIEEYRPSEFHRYKGVREELEKLKFES